MTDRPRELERAFELARSGECRTVTDIKAMLKAEGFSGNQISGSTITRQLRELCAASNVSNDA